ncbi:8-oxo-dGTP diphosphatase MutT [Hankyongella ginsenosidimutans]|uniref:8-oxo-dGTP diphosphatase MutT n=1 Tax=Hankyongella ginsenosidimutans TaxID=1763828 RepID=UPI001CA331D5|nr:8-oxo-dGTP diphosphatase MutT [Hankyongella ginsenosidimutans]
MFDTCPQTGIGAPGQRRVWVVAAALIDADSRVLVAQRPAGKSLAGLWEFPGGKIEPGEAPEAALVRELQEELGIDTSIACFAPLTFASHAYPDFHLVMLLYACRKWSGQIRSAEGQAVRWVRLPELYRLPMPPADVPLVGMLQALL